MNPVKTNPAKMNPAKMNLAKMNLVKATPSEPPFLARPYRVRRPARLISPATKTALSPSMVKTTPTSSGL
jgi:hypothetical protein